MTTNVTRYPGTIADKAHSVDEGYRALERRINSEIKSAQATIEKFKADMAKNGAAYAFSWGDGAMRAAAALSVWYQIQNNIGEGSNLRLLRDIAEQNVLQAARYPQKSTSDCSNLIEQYGLSAWAEVASFLSSTIEFLTDKGVEV